MENDSTQRQKAISASDLTFPVTTATYLGTTTQATAAAAVTSSSLSSKQLQPRSIKAPLLPLLPKPAPPKAKESHAPVYPQRHPPSAPIRNKLSGCFVPICCIPQCRLRTHHQFTPQVLRRPPVETLPNPPGLPSISPLRLSPSPLGRGLDALPALPINGLDESQLRSLFHLFMTRDLPRVYALTMPPALTGAERAKAAAMRDERMRAALGDPIYCLNVIAAAYLNSLYLRDFRARDKVFPRLHGMLLANLRTKLNNFTSEEVDDLIPIIFTVVQFDLVQGNLALMETSRRALSHLVASVGGVHNIGQRLALLMNLDRVLAMCNRNKPLFTQRTDRTFLAPPRYPPVYGASLSTRLNVGEVDQSVINFCNDICRATEILEAEKWSFNLGDQIPEVNVSNIHYFYFIKNMIANEFAHLQAEDFSATRKSRSVLLAANIVQYIVLVDCYIVPLVILLADRLKETLELRDIRKEWAGWEDVLRWMLCVLLSLPQDWSGREWTFAVFSSAMSRFYANTTWPPNWAASEIQNVRGFVWSDTRLGQRLSLAFDELQRERLETMQMPKN